ncbi:hypothetical protein [Catenibacterium mitsuokai]|uniref:hypothetical protein n=1 Tax=Catenibacterium mitsuokai TaxID=100886 RepID=UPI00319E9984
MSRSLTKEQRHKNMSAIKGKDTSIEVKVRKYLWAHGFRYRKNVNEYSANGRPLVTVEKSTQYADQVHLAQKLNTLKSPLWI